MIGARTAGLWRVRNTSDFGIMLLTKVRPARGERLSIALSDEVRLDGRVVWCRDDACGVEFDRPVDSAALLKALAAEQSRGEARPPRVEANVPAAAWTEHGIQSIQIDNVSHHGLGFSHDGSVSQGMKLRILFDGGIERRGMVRWADGRRAGLQLLDPLTRSELEKLGLG